MCIASNESLIKRLEQTIEELETSLASKPDESENLHKISALKYEKKSY
jgi:predicted metal-dependent enzyme (double-stranded beta helix superfamily)